MLGRIAFVRVASYFIAAGCALLGAMNLAAQESTATTAAKGESNTAASAPAPKFGITEFRVLGNTVLPVREVELAVYPFLGPGKSIADVQSARLALENSYHKHGYGTVFVDIPEQQVEQGIVRLKVTEGKLAAVRSTGARYFSERQIRAALPEATAGKVPSLPALQSELAEVNSVTADRIVTPVLKAGTAPGTVDLALRVEDHLPFHGSLELNNQYTVDTKPLRAMATLSYGNAFGRYDTASLQYQLSPQDTAQVGVIVANYLAHAGPVQLAFYYLHSSSDVATLSGAAPGTAGAGSSVLVLGRGQAGGAHLIVPLENSAAATQSVSFGAEYKDFLQAITPQGNPDPNQPSTGLSTPIHYTNLSLAYDAFWRGAVQRSLDVSANVGLRSLSANTIDFDNKRFQARPNFFFLKSAFSMGATLPANFTLIWRLAAQYAAEPIISNEQFAIAGADGVRGYLEAEELGDRGAKTTVQLGSPRLQLFANHLSSDLFAFFDAGLINALNPLPQQAANTTLRSWGVGFNIASFDHFTGSLTWSDPLANGSVTRSGDSRFLFSVRSTW